MTIASQVETGRLKGYFDAHRTLETYPTGWYRWSMLVLALFATIVASLIENHLRAIRGSAGGDKYRMIAGNAVRLYKLG